MNRKNILFASLVLLIASGATAQVPCSGTILPNATLFVNWPQFQYDSAHTGCNPYESVLKPSNVWDISMKWKDAAGEASYTSAVVADGMVYVSLTQCCHYIGRYVYALNATTGEGVWGYGDEAHTLPFSSPVVAKGIVYFGSQDNNLYALDAKTGAFLWMYPTRGVVLTPTVADGVVYIGSGDNHVYALNAATGALIWQYATGVGASVAVANGVVYVGSDQIYALNASTGALIWQYPKGSGYSPSVAGGKVYVVSDQLYALNATTGALVWNYPATGTGTPAVGTGVVYLGSSDGKINALNAATGALIWQYQAPPQDRQPSSPVVANGVVYVGYNDYFRSLDAGTGTLLDTMTGSDQGWNSATVANGMVFASLAGGLENSGALYAFWVHGQ